MGGGDPACKVCAFLTTLPPAQAQEWQDEMRLPVTVISHMSVMRALGRRDVDITEASVRRHRRHHLK